MTCKICGRHEDLRFGVCFTCATEAEAKLLQLERDSARAWASRWKRMATGARVAHSTAYDGWMRCMRERDEARENCLDLAGKLVATQNEASDYIEKIEKVEAAHALEAGHWNEQHAQQHATNVRLERERDEAQTHASAMDSMAGMLLDQNRALEAELEVIKAKVSYQQFERLKAVADAVAASMPNGWPVETYCDVGAPDDCDHCVIVNALREAGYNLDSSEKEAT